MFRFNSGWANLSNYEYVRQRNREAIKDVMILIGRGRGRSLGWGTTMPQSRDIHESMQCSISTRNFSLDELSSLVYYFVSNSQIKLRINHIAINKHVKVQYWMIGTAMAGHEADSPNTWTKVTGCLIPDWPVEKPIVSVGRHLLQGSIRALFKRRLWRIGKGDASSEGLP